MFDLPEPPISDDDTQPAPVPYLLSEEGQRRHDIVLGAVDSLILIVGKTAQTADIMLSLADNGRNASIIDLRLLFDQVLQAAKHARSITHPETRRRKD